MTADQTYLLSMLLIVFGSVAVGFLLGRPYWFYKGLLEGIEHGGDIWDDVLNDDGDDDQVINSRRSR